MCIHDPELWGTWAMSQTEQEGGKNGHLYNVFYNGRLDLWLYTTFDTFGPKFKSVCLMQFLEGYQQELSKVMTAKAKSLTFFYCIIAA